jgi:polysaccharide export outer membrane protein
VTSRLCRAKIATVETIRVPMLEKFQKAVLSYRCAVRRWTKQYVEQSRVKAGAQAALFLVLALNFSGSAIAADGAALMPTPAAVSAHEMTPSVQHRLQELGEGDSVALQVYGQPDMTETVYVDDDGAISVPLVGPVKVAGSSSVEAGLRVERALKEGKFLVDPHVTITIVQSRSQRVSVLGEIKSPGRYGIDPNTNIMDLLALAGGTTDNSADVVTILRPDGQGNVTRHEVDLKRLSGSNTPLPTEALRGGDSVLVPRAQTFYIYGEVATPSKYRVEPSMTVIQAIARAGGVTVRGSTRRIEIKRTGSNGQYVTTKAKLSDLVQADDVIQVKESIF